MMWRSTLQNVMFKISLTHSLSNLSRMLKEGTPDPHVPRLFVSGLYSTRPTPQWAREVWAGKENDTCCLTRHRYPTVGGRERSNVLFERDARVYCIRGGAHLTLWLESKSSRAKVHRFNDSAPNFARTGVG